MFYYVPAGINSIFSYVGVRYKKKVHSNRFISSKLKKGNSIVSKLELPDRELFLSSFPLSERDFDKIVVLNPILDPEIDYCLITPHMLRLESQPFIEDARAEVRKKLILDSGGAQIASGAMEYINPVDVIRHNRRIKPFAGVTLDIPVRTMERTSTILNKASALAQAKVSVYFRSSSDLRWICPVQCRNYNTVKFWLDYVVEPWYFGFAITAPIGLLPLGLFALVDCVSLVGTSKLFHFLAHGSLSKFSLLAWIGKYLPFVTADSTTGIANVYRGRRFFGLLPNGGFLVVSVGGYAPYSLVYSKTGCDCLACRTVGGYLYAYAQNSRVSTLLLSYHNTITLVRAAKFWTKVAMLYDLDDYVEIVKTLVSEDVDRHLFELVKILALEGPEAAKQYIVEFKLLKKYGTVSGATKPSVWEESSAKGSSGVGKSAKVSTVRPLSCYLSKEELRSLGLEWDKRAVTIIRRKWKLS